MQYRIISGLLTLALLGSSVAAPYPSDADAATNYVVDKRSDADAATKYVVDKRSDADAATKYVVD